MTARNRKSIRQFSVRVIIWACVFASWGMAIAQIVFARKTVAGFQIEAGQQVLYGLAKSNYYVSYGLDRPLKFAFEWGLLFVLIQVTRLITFREPLRRWWWAIAFSVVAGFVGISGICGAAEPMIP